MISLGLLRNPSSVVSGRNQTPFCSLYVKELFCSRLLGDTSVACDRSVILAEYIQWDQALILTQVSLSLIGDVITTIGAIFSKMLLGPINMAMSHGKGSLLTHKSLELYWVWDNRVKYRNVIINISLNPCITYYIMAIKQKLKFAFIFAVKLCSHLYYFLKGYAP